MEQPGSTGGNFHSPPGSVLAEPGYPGYHALLPCFCVAGAVSLAAPFFGVAGAARSCVVHIHFLFFFVTKTTQKYKHRLKMSYRLDRYDQRTTRQYWRQYPFAAGLCSAEPCCRGCLASGTRFPGLSRLLNIYTAHVHALPVSRVKRVYLREPGSTGGRPIHRRAVSSLNIFTGGTQLTLGCLASTRGSQQTAGLSRLRSCGTRHKAELSRVRTSTGTDSTPRRARTFNNVSLCALKRGVLARPHPFVNRILFMQNPMHAIFNATCLTSARSAHSARSIAADSKYAEGNH